MPIASSARTVAISSPLGEDVLLFLRMTATEELGRMFQFDVEMISENFDISHEDILGQNMTVRMELPDGNTRYFNGFASRFTMSGSHGRFARYHVTLRPWLWFLTRTSDCRIFQKMKVPDILKKVFRDHGFTDFQESLSGSYRTWEYNVQYRETDFNFVSRLMEQEGIYYYFQHENGKHTLVLSDGIGSHAVYPGYERIALQVQTDTTPGERDQIITWSVTKEVQPGKCVLNDFDFKNPTAKLEGKATVSRDHAVSGLEIYDYPGEYEKKEEGDTYARARLEELQARYEVAHGTASARGIMAGALFTLEDHPREDQNREYLVVSASHHLSAPEYESGVGSGGETRYSCSFACISSDVQFRAARITPKPVVQGPQTAIVVGKAGEEIWPDEFGRVKLQFHWDRYGKADENSSCWVRVAQVWAGKGWGGIALPRIGQEVIVDFLEEDPDRPIVTGRVYNGANKPPYRLPDYATLSGIKSNSSKGGGGFNEIRFEDKKGEEQVMIHAQKDEDIIVLNDCRETIGNDRHLIVKNNQLEKVEGDRSEEICGDQKEKVGGDRNVTVGGAQNTRIQGKLSLIVTGDVDESFEADHSEATSGKISLSADKIVLEAQTNVTISAGGSELVLDASGIDIKTGGIVTIQGSLIKLN